MAPSARAPRTSGVAPTLDVERELARAVGPDAIVVGLDEVGRGALAGPVVVGACAVRILDGAVATPLPDGVRDSKALTPRRREALVEPIRATAHASALGWARAAEIDEHGIVGALTLAALRALEGVGVYDAILLDGSADVLTGHLPLRGGREAPRVALRVGADRDCASVAAASVLAKVARDAHMRELALEAPEYAWERNKGYGAAVHREAIVRIGAHAEHRRTWNLLGSAGGSVPAARSAPAPDVLWGDDAFGPAPSADGPGPQEESR